MSLHAAVALDVVGEVVAYAFLLGCATLPLTLLGFLDGGEHDGGSDSDGGGGGGGGGDRPVDRPPGGGDHAEPAWWPQFERDFAKYCAARTWGDRISSTKAARLRAEAQREPLYLR